MDKQSDYLEANRQIWDDKTPFHVKSNFYDVDTFKQTKNSLNAIELVEVGNVQGKSLLHLQCHFGLDTLSWAHLGATVTGVDFAPEAIRTAQQLSEELELPAQFVCSNVLELEGKIDQKFDIVYTSYGVICWLPDLQLWARTIAERLKPGGFFYIAETHPLLMTLDPETTQVQYSYFNTQQPDHETITGTYADETAPLKHTEYTWGHSIGEVVNALIDNGLKIDFLNERAYYPYNCFANMQETTPGSGWWQVKGWGDKVPHLFSIKATRTLAPTPKK
ncbi:bifunctional 2-polyprenyl-6-hydroxyphenol methylase/3-demethylubiquinol 3-O-methyltransferase UbiG [uncultured Microscilla sp.]|uniref:class I SAM-dependent methyltransferase n=1 Tax=uncultured Microscilla sp. TaxID=432653 RepID=UPI0026180352|nr:class I SAM-dependent methyltransferase [uncultured Microscilla sp.]